MSQTTSSRLRLVSWCPKVRWGSSAVMPCPGDHDNGWGLLTYLKQSLLDFVPHLISDVTAFETDVWSWRHSDSTFPKQCARILQRTAQTTNQKRSYISCLPTVKGWWLHGNKWKEHNDSCLVSFEVWARPLFVSQWIFPLRTLLMPLYKTSLKSSMKMKFIVITQFKVEPDERNTLIRLRTPTRSSLFYKSSLKEMFYYSDLSLHLMFSYSKSSAWGKQLAWHFTSNKICLSVFRHGII